MRIEELHLKNFRCFKELDIQFPKSNLAVFIGLNGAGKSAILDVITLLLIKFPAVGLVDRTVHIYKLVYEYTFDDISTSALVTENEIFINYRDQNRSWKEKFYRDNRRYDDEINKHSINDIDMTCDDNYICIYYTTNRSIYGVYENWAEYSNFYVFDKWFEEVENFENELKLTHKNFEVTYVKLDVVRKAIEIFCSHISGLEFSNLKVKRTMSNEEIIGSYKEEIEKHTNYLIIKCNGEEIKFSQLSEGQRLLLHLVGDIAFRLTKKNTTREGNGFQDYGKDITVKSILESKGVVLIDEIELHLHPQWQREVLPALQKTFPNIQFIVTTHSPQVLSNLKKEEVFILKDNKIIEVTPHIEGRDSNSILYELFGVEERPEFFKAQLKQLYNAIDDENLSEAKKILAELTTAFGEQDTEIVRANLHLSFAEE